MRIIHSVLQNVSYHQSKLLEEPTSSLCSIDRAANGENLSINEGQGSRAPYDRTGPDYPYQSWGQWLKATIGLVCCTLLAIFNGWRSFVSLFSRPDFIASYISVRNTSSLIPVTTLANNFGGGRLRPLSYGLPCSAR
jgi:hypothetical protein